MLQKIPPHHTTSSSIKIKAASRPCPKQSSVVFPSLQLEAQHAVRSSSTQHSPARYHLLSFFSPPFLSLLEFYSTHIDAYSQAIGSFFSYPRHLQSLLSANSKLPASLIPLQQGWSGSLPSPLFIFKAQPNLVLSKRSLSWGFSNPDCDIGSLAPHSVTSSQPRAEKPISASFFRFLPNANRN